MSVCTIPKDLVHHQVDDVPTIGRKNSSWCEEFTIEYDPGTSTVPTIENVFGYLNYFVANEIEMSDDQVCLKMQLIHFSNPVDIGYWND